jgi:hypothetical protein
MSGALLVKLAYALQTLVNIEPGWRYASWYLKLPNVKPTQDGSIPAASRRKTTVHQQPANLFLSYLFYCTMYIKLPEPVA